MMSSVVARGCWRVSTGVPQVSGRRDVGVRVRKGGRIAANDMVILCTDLRGIGLLSCECNSLSMNHGMSIHRENSWCMCVRDFLCVLSRL